MNATITRLNTQFPDTNEKLLAATYEILRLETAISAAADRAILKQAQIESLISVSEATLAMLKAVRSLFPDRLHDRLDSLLMRSAAIIQLVQAS